MTDKPRACERCGREGTALKLPPTGEIKKDRLYVVRGRWLCKKCGLREIAEWTDAIRGTVLR